jgi:methylated-DNA-[protein]-cysteine S-methyltransferase
VLERNPLPLVVPCHRILPSRQGIGTYVGGAHRKRWLLKLERESGAPPA